MNIKTYFADLWAKIKHPLGDFFKSLLKTTFAKELEVVLPIAQRMVVAIEDNFIGDGPQKRAAAFDLILNDLAKSQKVVGANAINTAIELAVAAIRAGIAA